MTLPIDKLERLDTLARALAHELFAHECFAYSGRLHGELADKPHSKRCQAAAQRINRVLRRLVEDGLP